VTGAGTERVIRYKRWLLCDEVAVEQVAELVRDSIVPFYAQLSEDVTLGLELCAGERAVLAIQRWRDRSALEEAMEGPTFKCWWSEYQPILSRWDALVVFDLEWEALELIT